MLDNLKVSGKLKIVMTKANGTSHTVVCKNLVVNSGLDWIANRLTGGTSTGDMSHMAIGSSATAAAAGDTTLSTELGRAALTSTNVTAPSVEYAATFVAGVGTGLIVEAGVFNDPTSGEMLARTTFAPFNKEADDSMTITWLITLAVV